MSPEPEMHRVLSAALTLSLVAARLAVGQIGLTELATVTLGRPVQGMLPGTVIADISNQCGVCAQGAFFVVDLAGPGIIPGVNSAYVVLRRWSDPDGADPALYCPLAPLGFLGARANLVYEIVATDAGQVVIFGAHQPLPGQPVQYLIQVTAGLTGPQPHIIYREGDSYADAPAGVASSAVFDFAYAGPDHLLVMALLTGAGVTPADDRIALTGSVRNNMRKLMREGEQPPASPAESLTHSLTGLGPVTCTSEGWGLVPASLRIPGSDPNLVRACLYLYSLQNPQAIHRIMTVGDAAADSIGVAQGSPGVVTNVYNARVHREAWAPLTHLSFSSEARVAPALGQSALRRQVAGRIQLATGAGDYTLSIGQGDALLNTPGFTYTSTLTTGYTNSSGREAFVFDGTNEPGLGMSDTVFCTADSPFTARLREDDPVPGGVPAGARIATMEVCSLSTDGTALLYTGFRNSPGAEAGVYAFSPRPSNQFQLLARLGETITVSGQPRTVININAPRSGTGSNGEDGRSRKIVPQGAALVLLLENGNRAVKLWRGAPPVPCLADVGSAGGVPGVDGLLDNNDFVVFIDTFFAHDPAADVGVSGGLPGADGEWNNNDFVVYIDRFFAGC